MRKIDAFLKQIGRTQLDQNKMMSREFKAGKTFPGYKKFIERKEFTIYRAELLRPMIVAAHNNVVVTRVKDSDTINIYPDYLNRIIHYTVKLSNKRFPDLISGSHIAKVLVLPYLREIEKDKYGKRWRVVVITDKCQVYHNFPKRNKIIDDYEIFGDIVRFEESAVWDIPKRRYPSKTQECDETEIWFPCLPDACYEYHPGLNQNSKYGNDGFDKFATVTDDGGDEKVSRFYFPTRTIESNPFIYMGGFETDYKMTLIGTYQSNKKAGSRIVVFASSDGGRNWYAKIEFGDEGNYDFNQGSDDWGFNYGNKICYGGGFDGGLIMRRRSLLHGENTLFKWDNTIDIAEVLADNNGIVVRTTENHNLSTGNIIAFQMCGNVPDEWKWLLNEDIHPNSSGNGILFKVEVLNNRSFYICENIMNPFTNIACRHIHHINRIRDGWIIGTGEIYPNGWLIYAQMLEADTYALFDAADKFNIYILNRDENSVQRTVGADILDQKEPLIIFASDHDKLDRHMKAGEKTFRRNSVGIYKGALRNIDDFTKFELLYEAKEPAYFFKKLDNHYVFSGQRGELAISTGDDWTVGKTDEPMIHYLGSTCQFHIIDKYLIVFK